MITEIYKETTVKGPTFLEPHSLAIRIWHWALVVFIFGAVTTVVLATFVFNTGQNIPMVQQQLQGKGIAVDASAARAVSHAFNDRVWFLHKWIGYGIVLLVLARGLLEVFQPAAEKVAGKMRSASGFMPTTVEHARAKKLYLTIKWVYVVFYVLILVMALTGLVLAFEDVPFFQSIRRPVKSVHNFNQYLIYAFALIHIAGVVRADNLRYPGLVSRMIGGGKTHL
jgi:Ni/Fe-hydrogenase 1 B-type cytochrome subunit